MHHSHLLAFCTFPPGCLASWSGTTAIDAVPPNCPMHPQTPFQHPDTNVIVARAREGAWAFEGAAWMQVSDLAKHLVQQMLQVGIVGRKEHACPAGVLVQSPCRCCAYESFKMTNNSPNLWPNKHCDANRCRPSLGQAPARCCSTPGSRWRRSARPSPSHCFARRWLSG